MMPPSTREVMNSVGSKYAVVVGISRKAREMSAKKELEEKEGRLADMVNHTLEELIDKKLVIQHILPAEESQEALEQELSEEEMSVPEEAEQELDEAEELAEEILEMEEEA